MKGAVEERDSSAQLWLHEAVDGASSRFCQHFCETSGVVLLKSEQVDSFRNVELTTSTAHAKNQMNKCFKNYCRCGPLFHFPCCSSLSFSFCILLLLPPSFP